MVVGLERRWGGGAGPELPRIEPVEVFVDVRGCELVNFPHQRKPRLCLGDVTDSDDVRTGLIASEREVAVAGAKIENTQTGEVGRKLQPLEEPGRIIGAPGARIPGANGASGVRPLSCAGPTVIPSGIRYEYVPSIGELGWPPGRSYGWGVTGSGVDWRAKFAGN